MGKGKTYTTESFIQRSKEIWGNEQFNYSNTTYVPGGGKINLYCNKHNVAFQQFSGDHIKHKLGCPCCKQDMESKNQLIESKKFLEDVLKTHPDSNLDFSKIDYVNDNTKVKIICPIHGELMVFPRNLRRGSGCKYCQIENMKQSQHKYKTAWTNDYFIQKSKEIWGEDTFDYSECNYINSKSIIKLRCIQHDKWFTQTAHNHIAKSAGCDVCKLSKISKMEKELMKLFSDNNISYEYQYSPDWLGKQSLDFFIPSLKVAIECQGEQHYISIDYFGGKEKFEKQQKLDSIKRDLCHKNEINLIYYVNHNLDKSPDVLKTSEELLQYLLKLKTH